ncbi:MAG: hypothetical protein OXN83_02850 [Oligoflexia bacterium]|nr:hypothetical protein [Oligoflexia bacterium]
MKIVLVLSFLALFVNCGRGDDKTLSSSPRANVFTASSAQLNQLQSIIDTLNQKEAEMQKIANEAQKVQEIPESELFGLDKEDLADQWSDVKEKLEAFRQVVKDYHSVLQEGLNQPLDPLSFKQVELMSAISKIYKDWSVQLEQLNIAIKKLGVSYSEIQEQYQLDEIIKVWNSFYENWREFSSTLEPNHLISSGSDTE